ncbi:MAG TPA: TolC family outer membrane protein [Candidatus Polarisedimenticolia bacterium]|nr:TolC family outer membrane protein [Candidatus Polarisedimenticolia bacterium]
MPLSGRRRRAAWVLILALLLPMEETGAADLIDLYTKARQFDPVFRAAEFELQISEQVIRESQSGVLPSLTAEVERSRTKQDVKESDSVLFQIGEREFDNTNFAITLIQPIYRSSAWARLPQARAEARQAEANYAAAEQDLMFRLAQAHFNFMAARDNLDFATAERTAIWRQLLETEERLGSGLATITDLHDARARFALAEAAESGAADVLEEARAAIMEITGDAPADLNPLSESFPYVPPDKADVEAWVEAAMFQNNTIRARREAATVAEQEIRRQRGVYLPSLDFVASFNDRDTEGTVFGGGNRTATADFALRLAIPIYDGGRGSALAAAAALRHRITLEELEREKRRVERETRTSFNGVMGGIARVEALIKSVFSNERALAAREEAFRSGIGTGVAVLDARRDLYSAKRDLSQARYLYILNSLRLKQSAGTLSVADLRQVNVHLH